MESNIIFNQEKYRKIAGKVGEQEEVIRELENLMPSGFGGSKILAIK